MATMATGRAIVAAGSAAVALLAVVGTACSSDSATVKPAAGNATGAPSVPEDERAPAAQVAGGLHQIDDLTAQIAQVTGSDQAKAKDLTSQIEPIWQQIEGTVKANDPDAYITFEDGFAAIEKAADAGDAAGAQKAAASVHDAVTSYLGKYPG